MLVDCCIWLSTMAAWAVGCTAEEPTSVNDATSDSAQGRGNAAGWVSSVGRTLQYPSSHGRLSDYLRTVRYSSAPNQDAAHHSAAQCSRAQACEYKRGVQEYPATWSRFAKGVTWCSASRFSLLDTPLWNAQTPDLQPRHAAPHRTAPHRTAPRVLRHGHGPRRAAAHLQNMSVRGTWSRSPDASHQQLMRSGPRVDDQGLQGMRSGEGRSRAPASEHGVASITLQPVGAGNSKRPVPGQNPIVDADAAMARSQAGWADMTRAREGACG